MKPFIEPTGICQIEIPVSDVPRALEFYDNVFGWKKSPADIHEYVVMETPRECGFGISLLPINSGVRSSRSVTIYWRCDNLEGYKNLCQKYGGKVRGNVRILPGYGEALQIEDPDGNVFGLFLPLSTE